MVTLNTASALSDRVKIMTGDGGAPRISGLRTRPPCISQAELDRSIAAGEPEFVQRGGLIISRPITDEMACRDLADKAERPSSYVESGRVGLPDDMPSWLKRETALAEMQFEAGTPAMSEDAQEAMIRQVIVEFNSKNEGN